MKLIALKLTIVALLLASFAWADGAKKNPQQRPANPNAAVAANENKTEKASGITDAVDITDGPRLEAVFKDHAVLAWTTNKTAATRVVYGTDPAHMSGHAYHPGGSRNHRVELTGLKPGTHYFYAIENRYGKQRFDGQFDTPKQ